MFSCKLLSTVKNRICSTTSFTTSLRATTRVSVSTARYAAMATNINKPRDPNTLSNYNNWRTTHTKTSFEIFFDQQKLEGSVTHTLKSITQAETKEILLDTSYVDISFVNVNGKKHEFELISRVEPYGSPLKIKLEKGIPENESIEVSIGFATTPSCTALQWLTPAQTSNKKHPYMFSQCQAIHARSIFPCQDTPDVKATFDFDIKSPLPVLASGLPDSNNPSSPSATGKSEVYKFHQAVPIPSYLFAIASGDIAVASIGPRSNVATGPDELADCKWELERDTERQLQAAESLIYPYAWGQYNVLVLPPSFPYGGMENPIYTFATPTIISGDRENVDVIAHELSHSWSGNLVSNASWEHFWLNEGWTTYTERRILGKLHGGDEWRDFSAIIGWKALTDSIEQYGEDHEFTKMVIDLKGKDPDDAFSSIPYEKGSTFIWYIEKLIGIENFDRFIPHYFETWRGRSLDSYDFKSTLLDFFSKDASITKKLNGIDWDTWFYKPGFPPKPDFNTQLVDVCYELADKWTLLNNGDTSFKPSPDDIAHLSANQVVVFLERLQLLPTPLKTSVAQQLGSVYALRSTRNVEVSSRYYEIAMTAGDTSIKSAVVDLLGKVGRMKFVRPMYRGLIKMDVDAAVECFERNRDFYHPICRAWIVKEIMGKTGKDVS